MKRISVKKWYRAILFLLLFSLLAGCQQSDAGSHTGSVQITPTDQIRVESMTLLEQVEYDLVPDAEHASVELYTSALIADDGQMGWDSGDQWTLLVRQEEQVFLLYDEYVQYGEVQFWISSLNTNGIESPETEDLDHHIYVMVTTSVGFTMYDYGWNGDEGCFQKSVLLNPETQWNTVHSNKYNTLGTHTFDKAPSEVTPDSVVEEDLTDHFTAEVVKYGNDALYVKVTDTGDSIFSIGDELYVGVANGYDDYPLGCTVEVVYSSEMVVDNYGIGHTTSVLPVISESEAILQLTDILAKYEIELGKDGEELWWDLSFLYVAEIGNEEAYVVDLRYGPNIESVMSGRRYGTFAISKTGSKAYMHNIVTGEWEPLDIQNLR